MDALRFIKKMEGKPLKKEKIHTLQINLGKKCNLACTHCHVDAGPHRTEELHKDALDDILSLLKKFPQIETVDLTGGAPEMNYGFREIVECARSLEKKVIVRSNLTVFFEAGFEDLPEYFARQGVTVVASLPCYLKDNVDAMRGNGVFDTSIRALKILNTYGYGIKNTLELNLVYNTPIPKGEKFSLAPDQSTLENTYKKFLKEQFDIVFNNLFTVTNIPCGRFKKFLKAKKLFDPYMDFLESSYNSDTIPGLMCKTELSIDYLGNVFDCDFHQVEGIPSRDTSGNMIHIKTLLDAGTLDIISHIPLKDYCLGCTAGAGSSCTGALTKIL